MAQGQYPTRSETRFGWTPILVVFAMACTDSLSPRPKPTVDASVRDVAIESGFMPEPTVENPVLEQDFPDPVVLKASDGYYAYATNAGGANIPARFSKNLREWTDLGDVLPTLGTWADGTGLTTWAPGVFEKSGTVILFYTAKVKGTPGQQCIGRATARSPAGPFRDLWSSPIACNTAAPQKFWSIDPAVYEEDGKAYLLWRQDDGTNAHTALVVSELDELGTNIKGGFPSKLLERTPGGWEDPVMENPEMYKFGDQLVLFYSANDWEKATYGVGYALCDSPLGPCDKKTAAGAWISQQGDMLGAGGLDVFVDWDLNTWAAMHGWVSPNVGYKNGGRRDLWLFPIGFDGTAPVLESLE